MMSLARSASLFLLVSLTPGFLSGCATPAGRPSHPQPQARGLAAPSVVTRPQVMNNAMRYATHPWTGTSANVRHGFDARGIRVDTPDVSYQIAGAVPGYWVPGQPTQGLPYQWGGFSTPEEFDAGLAAGLAAGDVYTGEKRALLHEAVTQEAVGIDCSGFVSRCWGLPKSYSTRELASLCEELNSWDDLKPGDILNIYNAHVMIFSGWMGPDRKFLAAYETGGPPDWKVMRHAISTDFLKGRGYRPLRYRGIREG
jgi:hypothetical protein